MEREKDKILTKDDLNTARKAYNVKTDVLAWIAMSEMAR